MGEHLWGHVDPEIVRLAAAFGGGLGMTYQELCGALSGGAMVIGLHFGPKRPGESEDLMRWAITRYRDWFLEEIGPTQCAALRDGLYGSGGQEPCSVLVQRAVRILLEVLDEAAELRLP
ncbi:MAG: C_GCAxxG_C_C family protein [Anaerolineae bacterium]|nr:C_GCAxxG_C_C family protein [Anaerolineae bacterium]